MTAQMHADPPTVAVLGAGPAGLMAAEVAVGGGAAVTVYDRMPSPGRKFLLAGRGGLNLTHSEPPDLMLLRYVAAAPRLRPALERFSSDHLRAWSAGLGQPTFVGSSGRVFPAAFKASPLLRAWIRRLTAQGVRFRMRHRWTAWNETCGLRFEAPDGPVEVTADAVVLALGGASWPRLGTDGAWTATLAEAGVALLPLVPSNCGFAVDWSPLVRDRFEGHPLKGIALTFEGRTVRGEATITRAGLEGGAVYALSAALRDAIAARGAATLHIDLRPDLDAATVAARWAARPAKQSTSTFLHKAFKLAPAAIALLNEARRTTPDPAGRPDLKAVAIRLVGTAPIAAAISTAGGVAFDSLDPALMLRARPGVFVAGEMLDWEAPTGGYLLQACFATGAMAGEGALAWLRARGTRAAD